MSATGARRVLVISYPYPPMPSVGGNRWLAMSKYLRRSGLEVEILTTGAFGSRADDAEHGVHRTGDLIAAPWLRGLLRRPPLPTADVPAAEDTPAPAIATRLLVPDMYLATWVPYAIAAARRLLVERRYDCLITTSAYESTHLIPLGLGSRRPAWVADFRDGWTFHPHKPPYPTDAQRRLDVWLERQVVTKAQRTIVVERPVGRDLRERLGVDAVHVPNGWDPELAPGGAAGVAQAAALGMPARGDRPVTLVHTGKLSGGWGRHPGTLFEAMAALRDRAPELAARIQLVLAGRLDMAERRLIEAAGLGEMLRYVGQLSRAQALALQAGADALVLITAPDLIWELPGKLFEYIGAGRPVLALADGNEAAAVVRETGVGWTVPPRDVVGIADALGRIASGELRYEPDPATVARYVYPSPALAAQREIERAIALR
jgi:glycosyltransferase involved in cell wall biosynthesis